MAPGDETTKNKIVARALGELCWTALFAKDIPRARWAGEQATALDAALPFARLNHAHALMYAGKTASAQHIYVDAAASGVAAPEWRRMIRDDFAELSARRLRHPQMSEIDRQLGP